MPTAQRAHTNEHTGFADETEIGVRLSGEYRFKAGGLCLAAWRSYASLFKIAPACQTQPAFENGLVGNSSNTWFRLEAVLQVSRKKLFNVEVKGANRQAKRPSRTPLCCTRKRNLPAGKHEYGRVALEGTSKNLCALDT